LKSPSACIRSMSTEPTMPRHPTKPVSFIDVPLDESYGNFLLPGSCAAGKGRDEPKAN
jgi:hypothetical protein